MVEPNPEPWSWCHLFKYPFCYTMIEHIYLYISWHELIFAGFWCTWKSNIPAVSQCLTVPHECHLLGTLLLVYTASVIMWPLKKEHRMELTEKPITESLPDLYSNAKSEPGTVRVDKLGYWTWKVPISPCQEAEMTTRVRLSEPYLEVSLSSPPSSGSLAHPKIATALEVSAKESLEGRAQWEDSYC